MPELPEVETVRRTLLPHLLGQRFVRVLVREGRLRTPVDAAALTVALPGRRVLGIRRRAKYLIVDLEGELRMLVHLGMTGTLAIAPPARPLAPHDHILWDLPNGAQLRFNDPRRFGLVEVFTAADEGTHLRLSLLGLEPLESGFAGESLYSMTRGSKRPIKSFLMDATRVAGVGNIYACEALFAAGIHPAIPAEQLSPEAAAALAIAVKRVLSRAIARGGTTLRDFSDADGEAGSFSADLMVYGRDGEPCEGCGKAIRRILQAGRSTFYCARCQPLRRRSRLRLGRA